MFGCSNGGLAYGVCVTEDAEQRVRKVETGIRCNDPLMEKAERKRREMEGEWELKRKNRRNFPGWTVWPYILWILMRRVCPSPIKDRSRLEKSFSVWHYQWKRNIIIIQLNAFVRIPNLCKITCNFFSSLGLACGGNNWGKRKWID